MVSMACAAVAGPPLKQQQMLERTTPLAVDPTLSIIRSLNFGVEHLYLDPSPNNEAGAAVFTYGHPGAEQSLLCQVSHHRVWKNINITATVQYMAGCSIPSIAWSAGFGTCQELDQQPSIKEGAAAAAAVCCCCSAELRGTPRTARNLG